MDRIHRKRRTVRLSCLAPVAACLTLTACGGSSSGSSSAALTSSTSSVATTITTAAAPKPTASPKQLHAAHVALARYVACLRAHGEPVTLGASPGPIINLHGVVANTPRYQAAAAKCHYAIAKLL